MLIFKGISGNRSVSVPVRVDILPSFGVISKWKETEQLISSRSLSLNGKVCLRGIRTFSIHSIPEVMSEDIKSQSTKKDDESEIAVDSREEIEGIEVKTSPMINPTTTQSTITEITTEEPTTTSFSTTVSTTTTTQTTTVPTTVSTTPTTTSSTTTETTTVTVPSTTVTTTEPTTTSTTTEPSTPSTSQFFSTTTESTTVSTTPSTTVTTTPSTTVVTIPSTTVSTTVQSTTTTHPSTAANGNLDTFYLITLQFVNPVPIRLNIEGLSENGSIPVKASLSKGELIDNFAITVERDGRVSVSFTLLFIIIIQPDGTLFNVTVDRSDLFDIQPKSVEQGGKAFLFVRNPHLIREIKGLTITVRCYS